ncbi:MAG TPA: response regulator [Terracidiphilus sp.]|jgi:DNA-binding NtrC family response regulator|nr:response regulator [Terracidiphilus sp.]
MPGSQKLRRIFVVDDEQVIASTLATILCNHGFDATSFCKPREALLASRSEAPDLLISDVVMPSLSGIELATQIVEAQPECKVILFSGQALTIDFLDGARKAGYHFEILTKPVHPAELLRKIETLADQPQPPMPESEPRKNLFSRSA